MDNLINYSYTSWTSLFAFLAFAFVMLGLLKAIDQVSKNYHKQGMVWKPKFLKHLAFHLSLILEPLFLISFIGIFISVNPMLHFVIMLVLITLLFQYLNSYFIGKYYVLKGKLREGIKIKVGDIIGQIKRFDQFGLEIREADNVHYILYSDVIKKGFTTLPNHTSAIVVNLKLKIKNEMKERQWLKSFKLFLFDIPYINIKLNPNVSADYKKEEVYIKVMLNEGVKETYLTEILIENGYELIH